MNKRISAVLAIVIAAAPLCLTFTTATAASNYIYWQTDKVNRTACANGSKPSSPYVLNAGFTNGQGEPDPDGGSMGAFMFNNCPISDGYSVGGFFRTNYEGKLRIRDIRVISIDMRNDSFCEAGSPRLRFTVLNATAVVHNMGCNVGRKSKIPGQPNWTRLSFTQADILALNPTTNTGVPVTLDMVINYFGIKYDSYLKPGEAPYSKQSWLDNFTLNNELTAYSDRTYYGNPIITPVMLPETVANIASQNKDFAPGTLAAVNGVDMSDCSQTITSGSYPTSLCGVKIKIGGIDAQLRSVTPTRVEFFVPTTAPTGNAVIFAERNGVPSQEGSIVIQKSSVPSFTLSNVVNAASYQNRVSPGSLATVFGEQLSDCTKDAGLATEACGTQVILNNTALQLLYVSPQQLNFFIPLNTPLTSTIKIKNSAGVFQPSSPLTLSPSAPGIFSQDKTGAGLGSIQLFSRINGVDSYTLANSSNAALPGQIVVMYGTGFSPYNNVTVSIGGKNAQILYVGSQNYYTGLDQINLVVPSLSTNISGYPVVACVNSVCSNSVILPVKQSLP